MSIQKTRKSDIKRLLREIKVRKKALFYELLATAGANLDNLDAVEGALSLAERREVALNRLRAAADETLKQYHGVSLKSGLRITADDLKS